MNKLLFSVVIPTCGRNNQCLRAIDSVLESFKHINVECEIILCLNGVLSQFAELIEYSKELPCVRIEYVGIVYNGNVARNAGINLAKGHWVTFLDDDDEYLEDRIKNLFNLIKFMEAHSKPADVILSPVYLVSNGSDKKLSNKIKEFNFKKNIEQFGRWQINGVCLRRDLAAQVKFDERLLKWQDTKFVIDITENTNVVVLEKPAAKWYQGSEGSIMYNKNKNGIKRDLFSFIILTKDLINRQIFSRRAYFKYLKRLLFITIRSIFRVGVLDTLQIYYLSKKLEKEKTITLDMLKFSKS